MKKNVETYAKNLEATVKDKDAHIGNLERLVRVKDQHIINLEKSIIAKEESITTKEESISNLENILKDKNEHIDSLEDAMKHKDLHIGNLENRVKYLEEIECILRNIYNSRGWKLLTYYYKIRDKVLPPNTLRRAIVKKVFNFLRHLKRSLLSVMKKKVAEGKFVYSIESNLNKDFVVGKGNAFYLHGWCYHTTQSIKHLYVLLDGIPQPIKNFGLVRKDVFGNQYNKTDTTGNSLNSGFWTVIPFSEIESRQDINLGIRTVFKNGKTCESHIGTIAIEPSIAGVEVCRQPGIVSELTGEPLVIVCMPTYNPQIKLFKRQIDSIIHQIHKNWICIINDDCSDTEIFKKVEDIIKRDRRFRLFRNPVNLGVYHNFERCLSMVTPDAFFVALSDQDDCWHEDKLSVLLSAFDEDTTLAYSDMNIVNESGKIIYDTYWTTRRNNFKELDLLIITNTITGASSLFRRELLDYILPFPERIGDFYYDNFIGCVALTKGEIKYIDRPLYDYYQHSSNIIGHCVSTEEWLDEHIPRFTKHLSMRYFKDKIWHYYSFYFNHYIRRVVIGNVLKLRCNNAPPEKKAIIDRFVSLEDSLKGLILQVIKDKLTRKEGITLGVEYGMLRSIIAKKLINVYSRLKNFA